MLIFKYIGPEGARKMLKNKKSLSLKFAYPQTFNDPYELFIQPDSELDDPEVCAFFDALVGEVPKLPTTCFSRTPESVTMWAHYARDHSGICLAFDEETLANEFDVAIFKDVKYSALPAMASSSGLNFAMGTLKNRHAEHVFNHANTAAYFTKRREWAYEKERRLVVNPGDIEDRHGLLLAGCRYKSIQKIIVGSKIPNDLRTLCEERAQSTGIPLLEFQCGRRRFKPYFVQRGPFRAFEWNGRRFSKKKSCNNCGEPSSLNDEFNCTWCSVTEDQRLDALSGSAFFTFRNVGVLPYSVSFQGAVAKGRLAKHRPT